MAFGSPWPIVTRAYISCLLSPLTAGVADQPASYAFSLTASSSTSVVMCVAPSAWTP